jgi:ATP:ADP antiporter, AAA family
LFCRILEIAKRFPKYDKIHSACPPAGRTAFDWFSWKEVGMKKPRDWSALFGIEPGEGQKVWLFLAFHFFLGIANTFSQTAAFSLFLSRFSAQQLSYVYILNAIIVPLLTALYLRAGRSFSFQRLLQVNIGALFFLLAFFWVGMLVSAADWIVFLLPVLFQVVVNFGIMAFWPLSNRLFTVRQGKRVFGLIGSGQWIAIVSTGFLMGPISTAFGTANLLALGVVGTVGAFSVLQAILRTYRRELVENRQGAAAAGEKEPSASQAVPWRERYVLLIFALVTVWWVGFFLLDNLFYAQAGARYPDAAQLAGFLGAYLTILGFLTLLMNFVLAGRIVSRYGLRTSLLFLPGLLVAFTAVLAVTGVTGGSVLLLFWMIVGAKLLDMTLGFSVDRSLQTLLYQPLPVQQRGRVQTIAEGSFQPLANGLAGLILLGLGLVANAGTLPLTFTLLLVAALWVGVAYGLGKEYPRKLVEAISKRRLNLAAIDLADSSTIQILSDSLRQPHPGPVIYAANCLEDANREALFEAIPGLLQHKSAEVRLNTYERIERLSLEPCLPQLRAALRSETFPENRRAGIRALLSFGKPEDFEKGDAYLNHPVLQVRLGAAVGMIRSGGVEGIITAGSRLLGLAHSALPEERMQAAQAIGEIGMPQFYQPLTGLLADADVGVRQAALRACGQVKSPRLWPSVIAALEDRKVRGTAFSALVSGGSEVLPFIQDCFDRAPCTPPIQQQLVMACGLIKSPASTALLSSKIEAPELEIRDRALYALNRSGYTALPAEQERFRKMIKEEAGFSAWLLAGKLDLPDERYGLVSAALEVELAHSLERIFSLLSFIANRQVLMQARQSLRHPSPEQRAYALEIIDTQLPQELKPLIIPLVDEAGTESRLKRLVGVFPQAALSPEERLREIICRSPDWNSAWLVACALFTANRTAVTWLDQASLWVEQYANPVVQDTRHWLSRPLAGEGAAVQEGENMFSIIEKVLILKKTGLFHDTPDDALVEVAQALEEVNCTSGQVVFEKGEPGSSMFLIASGKVRVYDGGRTFNYLEEGDSFGEMAVLDPEPRSATVAAVEDTTLLKIDQSQLYELIESRLEVARGIIQVLSRHLRHRMQDLNRLQNVLENPARI